MTGAIPNTRWLDGCVVLDEKGFVKTGPDLLPDDLTHAKWPLARPPHLLETSRPGIFAVGDVREWRPQSAKDRLLLRLFIKCFASNYANTRAGGREGTCSSAP
jgi:thioredoxin reductase